MFKPNLINMNVHSATCSCSAELYKQWYILADFLPNWDISRGFLHIINFAVRISEAAMKGVGDIIFHNLGAQWKGTPSSCDLSRFYPILFAARISEAAMGGAEVGRQNMINTRLSRVQRSLEGCDWWGEGRGILYFEASVVQLNDIRPWRPEIGPEGKPFFS